MEEISALCFAQIMSFYIDVLKFHFDRLLSAEMKYAQRDTMLLALSAARIIRVPRTSTKSDH